MFKGNEGCVSIGFKHATNNDNYNLVFSKSKNKGKPSRMFLNHGIEKPKKLTTVDLVALFDEEKWHKIEVRVRDTTIDVHHNGKILLTGFTIDQFTKAEGT